MSTPDTSSGAEKETLEEQGDTELLARAGQMKLALLIAREIFQAGDEDGSPCKRIQFKGGKWPDCERNQGGIAEEPLAKLIEKCLVENETRSGMTHPVSPNPSLVPQTEKQKEVGRCNYCGELCLNLQMALDRLIKLATEHLIRCHTDGSHRGRSGIYLPPANRTAQEVRESAEKLISEIGRIAASPLSSYAPESSSASGISSENYCAIHSRYFQGSCPECSSPSPSLPVIEGEKWETVPVGQVREMNLANLVTGSGEILARHRDLVHLNAIKFAHNASLERVKKAQKDLGK